MALVLRAGHSPEGWVNGDCSVGVFYYPQGLLIIVVVNLVGKIDDTQT